MAELPPQIPTHGYYAQPKPPGAGMAVAAMVLGIVSLALSCVAYISIPCAILALVLGFIARSKAVAGTGGGKGMATAGIICGLVSIVLVILFIAGVMAFLGWASNNPEFKKAIEDAQRQQQQQRQGTPALPTPAPKPESSIMPGGPGSRDWSPVDTAVAVRLDPADVCTWRA